MQQQISHTNVSSNCRSAEILITLQSSEIHAHFVLLQMMRWNTEQCFTQQFTYANKIHIASFSQKFSVDHLNQHGLLLQFIAMHLQHALLYCEIEIRNFLKTAAANDVCLCVCVCVSFLVFIISSQYAHNIAEIGI